MGSKSEIAALLERVKAATGPDRRLDRAIQKALDIGPTSFTQDEFNYWPLAVTSSVDAALALVERMLPGVQVQITSNVDDGQRALVKLVSKDDRLLANDVGQSIPLALVAALLTALEAQP